MAAAPVILDPIFPPAVMAVAFVLLGGAASAAVVRARSRSERAAWVLRLAMVVLLLGVGLRPAIPSVIAGPASTGGLEVYFVVDTTSSMSAEDYAPQPDAGADDSAAGSANPARPAVPADLGEVPLTRLDGAKSDIRAIAASLPGAEFSLTTFDASAVQRVPITSDTTALESAVSVLTPEISDYSRGSSIDEALGLMTTLLTDAIRAHPDRERVLFYLGDGEQTSGAPVTSFEILSSLIDGGAVLGYGTSDGGVMRVFDGFSGDDDETAPRYILDPTTGDRARSIVDENALQQIATDLGVGYRHRAFEDPISPVVDGIDAGQIVARAGTPAGPTEFYWLFAIPLVLLALREVLLVAGAIRESKPKPADRSPAEKGRRR